MLIAALCALGVVSLLWALFGALLLPAESGSLIYPAVRVQSPERCVRALAFLRGAGLLRCQVIFLLPADADAGPRELCLLAQRYEFVRCIPARTLMEELQEQNHERCTRTDCPRDSGGHPLSES